MNGRTPALLSMLLLLGLAAGCSGGGGGGGGDNDGGAVETTPPDSGGEGRGVGPPLPTIVDETGAPRSSSARRIAFTGVELVAMEDESIAAGHTVLVEDGLVTAIGVEGNVPIPGVTGVRIMWGGDRLLEWRGRIRAGELRGPRLYVASPGLEGDPPYWPASVVLASETAARAAVQEMHDRGFDFIKVYNQLPLELHDVVIDAARELEIPVVGHVPRAFTAEYAIAAGQATIEHFSGFAPHATSTGRWSGTVDPGKLAGIVEQIKLHGTWNCPTLTVRSRSASQVADLRSNPAFDLMSETMQSWLLDPLTQPPSADRATEGRLLKAVVKALQDADVGLLVGTDAGVQYVYAGFSIHEELANFVDAGLTPYQTLRAATVNAAAALGETAVAGTVTVGKRADLLLLDANPLRDIAHVNRRVGVMAAGHWYSQSTLMEMIGAR